MIKYRAENYYRAAIGAFEIIRETPKQVIYFIKAHERREAKASSGVRWFDTWEEAHAWLMEEKGREVENARRALEVKKSLLWNVRGMKPPAQDAPTPEEEA